MKCGMRSLAQLNSTHTREMNFKKRKKEKINAHRMSINILKRKSAIHTGDIENKTHKWYTVNWNWICHRNRRTEFIIVVAVIR